MRRAFDGIVLLLLVIACTESPPAPVTPPPPPAPVVYTDPPAYGTPFAGVPDTKDIVMYEVNLRAFSPGGDFAGVMAGLDDIKALGVNTIWLMPIYPVGQLNSVGQLGSPYSVKNYKEVNPEFGNLDDLRALVAAAHDKGMAVILDWVANHTSWDNPWIANVTWYTRNSSGAIIQPPGTNWADVADLDFGSAAMKRAMYNAMKYWILAANVDGYRCDYADGVPYTFWKQAIDTLNSIPGRDLVLLAEGARGDHFAAGFQLNYAWNFFGQLTEVMGNNQPVIDLINAHNNEVALIPAGGYKLRFTANHDEVAWNNTPLGLFGGIDGSMAAFVLASTMGGVPLVYNGQEVGCPTMLPIFNTSTIDWDANADVRILYTKLISIRSTSETLKQGALTTYADTDIVTFTRAFGGEEVLVIVNTRNSGDTYTLPAALEGNWTDLVNGGPVTLTTSVNFAAYEFVILQR